MQRVLGSETSPKRDFHSSLEQQGFVLKTLDKHETRYSWFPKYVDLKRFSGLPLEPEVLRNLEATEKNFRDGLYDAFREGKGFEFRLGVAPSLPEGFSTGRPGVRARKDRLVHLCRDSGRDWIGWWRVGTGTRVLRPWRRLLKKSLYGSTIRRVSRRYRIF